MFDTNLASLEDLGGFAGCFGHEKGLKTPEGVKLLC